MDFGPAPLKPAQQGRPEIEADAGIVVDDILNVAFVVENASRRVRLVTLFGDALVPVVVGLGTVLLLNVIEPGVFPGGLIKMAVYA